MLCFTVYILGLVFTPMLPHCPALLSPFSVKAYFHYGCTWRCVAREIETLSASLYLSPHKPRAAVKARRRFV